MKTPINTVKWMTFFRKNKQHRPEPSWDAPLQVQPAARELLAQSLAEFQLGDGGGPASLIAWNAEHFRRSVPGLDTVVDQWFEEEKEHSRLLRGLLRRFSKAPIRSHWSFELFCLLRRWLGVKFELQILTLTELSSTAYYWLVLRHCEDPCVRDVCSLILRDETGHVSFQNDRLACIGAPWSGLRGLLWRGQFWLSGMVAAAVLYASHGRCLRALGVSPWRFASEVARQFSRFLSQLALRARTLERQRLLPSATRDDTVSPAGSNTLDTAAPAAGPEPSRAAA